MIPLEVDKRWVCYFMTAGGIRILVLTWQGREGSDGAVSWDDGRQSI